MNRDMKQNRKIAARLLVLSGIIGSGILLNGCAWFGGHDQPVFVSVPGLPGSTNAMTAPGETTAPVVAAPLLSESELGNRFQAGDLVNVVFSGIEPPPQPHEERIKDDGTITLPLIDQVVATNKTPGELQKEIHDRYVPRFYRNLTITVKSQDQFYYVGGEVRVPNRLPYLGSITVLKAIQSMGGFTDFANKKKVKITRANGHIDSVNCLKALEDPRLDLPVYPGDNIYVPRRLW
jgi:polysaccharide export outer membrane protein